MTRNDKGFLIALCIGDGSLERQPSGTVRLKVEHSRRQEEYNNWKLERLHSILGGKKPNMFFTERVRKGTQLTSCYFRKSDKYFRIIRNWLYKPKKTLNINILNKLTAEGLAVWFMDDGNTEVCTKNSFRITLSCDSSIDECEIIKDYFLTHWNIKWNINKSGRLFRLRCSTIEARKLFDIISPYVISSMSYKLQVPNHLWHECKAPETGDDIV